MKVDIRIDPSLKRPRVVIHAPAATAEAISPSLWASTRADRPSSSQMPKYRSSVPVSSRAQISSTQSAPRRRAW